MKRILNLSEMKGVVLSFLIVFLFFLPVTKAQMYYYSKGLSISTENKTNTLSDDNPNAITNIGWQVGIGFGLYLAGNESANYYNGSGKNNLRRVLIDYPYNYQALKEQFNYDFDLDTNNLPQNMKYAPSVVLKFVSKYNFNENNGFVIDVGYSKHTTSDFFTLIINDPSNMTSEPTVELGKIWGVEERVNFNIGYIHTFGKPKKINPFFEMGVNVNDTKLKDNKAQVLSFNYSILDPSGTYYGYKQGGIGHGFYLNGGMIFNMGSAFAAHIGADFSLKKINLLAEPKYSKEWVFYIRLMYKNLFGSDA